MLKQKIREENAVKSCVICGIRSDTIDALNEFDIDGIDIPIIHQAPLFSSDDWICSECEYVLMRNIWQNAVIKKPVKNVFGLFFSLKKYVCTFVKNAKAEFQDMANDYTRLLDVVDNFDECLAEHEVYHKNDEFIPSLTKVKEVLKGINNKTIDISEPKVDVSVENVNVSDTDKTRAFIMTFDIDKSCTDFLEKHNIVVVTFDLCTELVYSKAKVHYRIVADASTETSAKPTIVANQPVGGFTM